MIITSEITKVENNVTIAYNDVNHLLSDEVALLDYVFPHHDGVPDVYSASELLYLRQSVASLRQACEILESKLARVLGE